MWTIGGLALGGILFAEFRKGGWWNKKDSSSTNTSATPSSSITTQSAPAQNTVTNTLIIKSTSTGNGLLGTLNQNSAGGVQLKDMTPVNLAGNQGRE